jgi:hypothetical protein
LALIVVEGDTPVSYSDLYILEWPDGKGYQIKENYDFLHDIAWAPDSKHLLLQVDIGNKDGHSILALFITNVFESSEILPVPIPIDGLSSGYRGGGLSWSPDGRKVLVQYFDGQEVALYRIDVTAQ